MKIRFVTLLACFFALAGTPARAESLSSQLTNVLLPFMLADVNLRPTPVSNQAENPFCTLFAMASFLQSIGNQGKDGERLPELEPGYLAVAYNQEYSSGANGTDVNVLLFVTAKHGIISRGAWNDGGIEFPKGWADAHRTLMDSTKTGDILSKVYEEPTRQSRFTGAEYFQKEIGARLTDWELWTSNYTEPFVGSWAFGKAEFRNPEPHSREGNVTERMRRAGFSRDMRWTFPQTLYDRVKKHIHASTPVLTSLTPGLTHEKFQDYHVVGAADLRPPGSGIAGMHTMLAIGHCDRWDKPSEGCAPFAKAMRERNIHECLVLQNSWSEKAHTAGKGRVCVSKPALSRMLHHAVVHNNFQ